jgi:1-phosphofructokinase
VDADQAADRGTNGAPRGRIVTVTPNPSIDRTIVLAGPLERGAVHRVTSALSQPGGKGVNISRACVAAGEPTVAVLPVASDDEFVHELTALGVDCVPVPPAGPTRVNLTITEPDGVTTKLNTAGPAVTAADLTALADAVLAELRDAAIAPPGWVVLAGSLPPGAPAGWYAEVAGRLRTAGHRVAVDTSDAALDALVAALAVGTAPSLLKPNAEELAAATGADPAVLEADPSATAAAARTLVERGAGAVLATLGGAGAVLVDATGAWHATPPPTTVVSTVGAGDASLCGYLLADLHGRSAPERVAAAVAYGSAAAGLPGTTVPRPADLRTDLVRVVALEPTPSTT